MLKGSRLQLRVSEYVCIDSMLPVEIQPSLLEWGHKMFQLDSSLGLQHQHAATFREVMLLLAKSSFNLPINVKWRSSARVKNNLSGIEWLSSRGFGGSVLLEEYDSVQGIEYKLNAQTQLNSPFPETLHSVGGNTPSCYQPLTKEIYAKNTGDLPLEVTEIKVSGACALNRWKRTMFWMRV